MEQTELEDLNDVSVEREEALLSSPKSDKSKNMKVESTGETTPTKQIKEQRKEEFEKVFAERNLV